MKTLKCSPPLLNEKKVFQMYLNNLKKKLIHVLSFRLKNQENKQNGKSSWYLKLCEICHLQLYLSLILQTTVDSVAPRYLIPNSYWPVKACSLWISQHYRSKSGLWSSAGIARGNLKWPWHLQCLGRTCFICHMDRLIIQLVYPCNDDGKKPPTIWVLPHRAPMSLPVQDMRSGHSSSCLRTDMQG